MVIRRGSPPQRTTRPAARNPKRQRREWARAYGSKERVEWVKSLPCCWCGVVGYSQNAHTVTGGGSRKADAETIVPLCSQITKLGCHPAYDQRLGVFAHEHIRDEVKALASETAAAWLSLCEEEAAT